MFVFKVNCFKIGGVKKIKKITGIILVFILVFILGFLVGSPNMFKTGNPIAIVNGIIKLNFNNESKIVQVSNNPQRYVSKIEEGNYPFVELMNKEGWKFEENMLVDTGYGITFSKNGERLVVKDFQFSRKYRVWEVVN